MKYHPASPMLDAIDAIIREEVIHLPVKDVHAHADEIRSIAKALGELATNYAEASVEMYITPKEKGALSGIPLREPTQPTAEQTPQPSPVQYVLCPKWLSLERNRDTRGQST